MDKKKIKILLVDDQPANLLVLESVLAELDEELVSVGSGEQALREVLENTFALVLLDVQMPTMNGFETAALIRRHPRTQELPIIFLTAANDANFPLEQAYALGAVDYLTKPFNPVVLRAKVAVFIDLHRKNTEIARHREASHLAALRSRDERIRLMLDNTRDYAFVGTDLDRVITEWEGGAEEILGWDPDSALGRSADMIFTPADRAAGAPDLEMRRALETGRAEDKRWHMRRDGSLFFADGVMVALRDDAGKLRGYAKIFRDATAGKLAAEQLAAIEDERERLYRQVEAASERMLDIFQRAPAFMCVMRGPQHHFEIINQRFRELVGERELIGRPVREAMPEVEGQGFFERLDLVYLSGQPFEGRNERLMLRRDGGDVLEQRFVDFVYLALREPDGAVSGVLVHGVDVTERALAGLLALGQRSALELAVSDAPLDDVLDVLANTAEEYSGGAGLAGIQLLERGRLRHAAGPSLPHQFMDALDALGALAEAGPGARAAGSGDTVAVGDIPAAGEAPAYRALAAEHGLRACRAMAIVAPSGAVLGVFCWYYREPRVAAVGEYEALDLLVNTASLVIGQRHEARERMAAEDRSHNILESISEGFLAIDGDWRITYANRAAELVTGRPREEMAGQTLWEVFPQARGTQVEQGLRRSAAVRAAVKLDPYYDSLGRWYEINSFPTPDGGIALYFRDETERRLAALGIRRLAAVAEQSPDFIGITNPEAAGIFLNPAGRRMCGIAPDAEISGYSLIDFFAPESRAFALESVLPALTGQPARWEGELRFAHQRTGAVIPVYFKGFAVRDENRQIIGLATVTRDITEQKRAEDELRRIAVDLSEQDHRKSEFLATLAHELRNPLAPIRTGLDLLRMAPPEPAALGRVVDMMDRQLGHLIHLVNDLLDVARITRGKIELKKELVELRILVSMALETSMALIEASGHALEVDLPADPIVLEVDATRIVQVLSNLLNNAAKYTPAGGRIAVAARVEGAQAVVTVSDSGVGIPAESLGTVFEMFTQVRGNMDRAQGGLGIGLSLVRRLAELHGGSIAASSAGRGHGSTFTLRLPLAGGAGRSGPGPGPDSPPDRGPPDPAPPGLRVLVVDDNADAAESLSALLAVLGHHPRVALDGHAGFALACAYGPQLVLVALTGWGARSDVSLAEDAGFDQHLTNPVSIDSIECAFRAVAGAGG